jgi:hypothetical protein
LTAQSSPVLAYLYRQIDGGIAFPAELGEAGLSGEVTAELNFDRQGHWIDSPANVKASSPMSMYFRLYVIHRLRERLSEPIPENLWKTDPRAFSVKARFVFDKVAPESVEGAPVGPQFAPSVDPTKFSTADTDGGQSVIQQRQRQGQFGRDFLFYRMHLASALEWKLGPFAGYGIVPAVGINPGWFVDKITNLIHHREKVDPLERYRDDPDW